METVRSRRSSQVRQSEIVQTVLALAAECGPGDITTADIAQAMGLTQGAVFRHFPNKDAIWLAVADWMEAELLQVVETASRSRAQPLEALAAMFRAHVGFAIKHPGAPRLIFHELQQPGDSAVKQRVRGLLASYRGLLMRVLKQAKSCGAVAREVDENHAATLFIGAIQGLVMQSMLAGSMKDMKRAAEGVFAVYLSGLGGSAK